MNSFCSPGSGTSSCRRSFHSKPFDRVKSGRRLTTFAGVVCGGFLVAFMPQRLNPSAGNAADSSFFAQPQSYHDSQTTAGDTTRSKDSLNVKRDPVASPLSRLSDASRTLSDTSRPADSSKAGRDSLSLQRSRLLDVSRALRDTLRPADTSKVKRDSLSLLGPGLLDSSRTFADSTHRADTLLHADTTFRSDTTYKPYYDSTYRVAQFVHRRYDAPAVPAFPTKEYSLYLGINSSVYQRELQMDTTGRFVTIREKVNGLDVKVPITMTLEDYTKERYEYEKRNNWRTFAHEYRSKEKQDDLANLFGAITNIDIPVPSNPVLSIFGPPRVNLHITGAVDIRAGFSHSATDQATISTLDQTSNTPDFNQDVQVTVDGTIGDKLKIGADWNTQRTFEYENQLKIKYTGYDDEIVQSVEAGNVSLQTPSLIGSSEALFGIKAKMQFGPLTLTGLVSQKKGQAKQITVSGGSQQNTHDYHAYEYAKTHFFLDTMYSSSFEIMHRSAVPTMTLHIDSNRVTYLDVWVSTTLNQNSTGQGARKVNAYIDLGPQPVKGYPDSLRTNINPIPGSGETGWFLKLHWPDQYTFDPYSGYISLNSEIGVNQALAVAYSTAGGTNYGETAASDTAQTIILKLVVPKNLQPGYKPAWDLQMKNIFSLGGKDLKKEGFDLNVYYKPVGGSEINTLLAINLLELMGLDKYSADNSPTPDGKFDFISGLTVDVARAEIIFPTLRPFSFDFAEKDPGFSQRHPGFRVPDSLTFNDVYDTTTYAAQNNATQDVYYMRVTSSTAQSNHFSLGGFNIVEGSVQVLLNGSPLQPNVDYTVDYIIGEVVIRNAQALVPGANLQVKYEQNDLFQIASKTQTGARGEVTLSQNTGFGFTIMNLNQATLSDKVRLGEEPTSNTILGVDGGTSMDLPFLTDALDAIPFLHAREMSTMRLSGEAAYILPNANTTHSTIASDNGASIAYIDDFEGAQRTIPLGLSYTQWKLASPPLDSLNTTGDPDSTKTYTKAKLMWYNNSPNIDPASDREIWPYKQSRPVGQDFVTTLVLNYDPNHRGVYNYSPNLDATLHRSSIGGKTGSHNDSRARRNNWSGIMRYISATAGNLVEQNMNYLEIWMKATGSDVNEGRLLVDVGRISEDAIPNKRLNSEDIITTPDNPSGIPTGVLHTGEDLGLDMLSDDQERADTAISSFLQRNNGDPDADPNDPSGDDYSYSTGSADFTHINGTEGNGPISLGGKGGLDGQYPDTEDLNGDGVVSLENNYLEYEVPLNSDSNSYIIGRPNNNGWYQFLIPLQAPSRILPAQSGQTAASLLQDVQYIRLWLSGVHEIDTVRIAEMNFVGNQWLPGLQNDSLMKISVVSIEDNSGPPDNYTSPPGVIRERDKTQPDQQLFGNEQALALKFNGLRDSTERQAQKTYTVQPLDVFSYSEMKMFVHRDPSQFQYKGPNDYDAEVFLRFGADTLNFYEYRMPIGSDPNESGDHWSQMDIVFSELTSIKSARDANLYRDSLTKMLYHHPGTPYGVKGNPSLTQIRYIGAGVYKPKGIGHKQTLTGDIWINELRVIGVDNTAGYAYHFDTQLKLSDFGQLAFNYSKVDPNFHSIDQRFGDRITHINWAMNSSFSLERFFPQEWQGTMLSFGYSHQEGISKPKYLPSTDILVDKAAARAAELAPPGTSASAAANEVITSSQSLHTQDSYSLPGIHFAFPWQAWYIRDILSKLSYNFTYTKSSDRDPSTIFRKNWAWNMGSSYSVGLPADYYIEPFRSLFNGVLFLDEFKEWKFYYVPLTSVSAALTAQRARATALSNAQDAVESDSRTFSANKSAGFAWKLSEGGLLNLSGDYGLSISRDLLFLDNDSLGRGFSKIFHDILLGGRDGQYGQHFSVSSRPKLPNVLNIPKYFEITGSYSVSYNWQNAFQSGDIGKSAGWDNNISLSSTFRLKSLTDPWFQSTETPSTLDHNQPIEHREGAHKAEDSTSAARRDSTKPSRPDSIVAKPPFQVKDILSRLKTIANLFIKIPILDYDNIGISYTQANHSTNSGIQGTTGFQNFWGRLPFEGSLLNNGPSLLYQLGLSTDPSGRSVFGFSQLHSQGVDQGLRAANATLTDQFSQSNNLGLRTSRPLWDGATLEINWKVGWQFNKTTTLSTDSNGVVHPGLSTWSGNVERSFLTVPPIFLFKAFRTSLEEVGKKYDANKSSGQSDNVALANAFENGLEAFPILSKFLGEFVPRANWTLRWDGLEKIAGLSSVVQRMSLEHAYAATFRRDFQGQADGTEQTNAERLQYGFSPLIGLNTTFKDLFKGSFAGTFRYNTTTTYDLNLSAENIVETIAQELSLSLSYSHRGFNLPLFGINLQNDIDLSMTYSRTRNSRTMHESDLLSTNADGTPLDGNTRTTMEPRVNYALSSRVRASVFYRFTSMEPDQAGSTIPGTTTNEAGVDIHIAIQ